MRIIAGIDLVTVNGQPGGLMRTADGLVIGVLALDIVDGRVKEIRAILNPDKLDHIGPVADVRALLRESRG
jgi:RNA polymerase sigma-70 factor (ECF subfamily)